MRFRNSLINGSLIAVVFSASQPLLAEPRASDSRNWIVGTWESHKLDYGEFGEWKGAIQVELVAKSPDKIELFLIHKDGKRVRAGDSQPSKMDDRTLFFGPIGSGLFFKYGHSDSGELILDLETKDTRIHIELKRAKK